MFRHIVLLGFEEGTDSETVDTIVAELRALPGLIPTLRSYVVGTDAGLADGNADLCAVADFDDVAGYEVYRDHEDHLRVISDHIRPVLASRTAIQFEL